MWWFASERGFTNTLNLPNDKMFAFTQIRKKNDWLDQFEVFPLTFGIQ